MSLEGTKNDRDIFKIVNEEVKEWWKNFEQKVEEKVENIQEKKEVEKDPFYSEKVNVLSASLLSFVASQVLNSKLFGTQVGLDPMTAMNEINTFFTLWLDEENLGKKEKITQ